AILREGGNDAESHHADDGGHGRQDRMEETQHRGMQGDRGGFHGRLQFEGVGNSCGSRGAASGTVVCRSRGMIAVTEERAMLMRGKCRSRQACSERICLYLFRALVRTVPAHLAGARRNRTRGRMLSLSESERR